MSAVNPPPGKRALNKAQTRLDILNAVYRMSKTCDFRDLKVKTIIQDVGITEMTFFNYFSRKEDILRYMMGIWALDLMVMQQQEPLSGEEAIRRLFRHTAALADKHPRLISSFVASLLSSEIEPTANTIEAADRYLLYPKYPELFHVEIPSGNDLLLQHLSEMNTAGDLKATLIHLASCFYGDVIVAHTAHLDLNSLYQNSLNLIFSSSHLNFLPKNE